MRLPFVMREFEQMECSLDIHLVCAHRCELGSRGQQCREMENQVDFKLGENALEETMIGHGPGEFATNERGELRLERRDVEGHDRMAVGRQAREEPVPYLAVGAGDEDG